MNAHVTEKNCIGCLACENICPQNAIVRDISSGFIRHIIDENTCVNCGLCLKVCPKYTVLEKNEYIQTAYAVKHMDASVLQNSTSGGAFSTIADTSETMKKTLCLHRRFAGKFCRISLSADC